MKCSAVPAVNSCSSFALVFFYVAQSNVSRPSGKCLRNTVNNLGVALIISVRIFDVHSGIVGSILHFRIWCMIELNKDRICCLPRICEKWVLLYHLCLMKDEHRSKLIDERYFLCRKGLIKKHLNQQTCLMYYSLSSSY